MPQKDKEDEAADDGQQVQVSETNYKICEL